MTDNFNAIETEYDGYRFRSRREARWAVFLDSCHADWEYEPEGFELGSGLRYLPDFLVHNVYFIHGIEWGTDVKDMPHGDLWIEVKKDDPDQKDMEKIEKFSNVQYIKDENGVTLDAKAAHSTLMVGNIPRGNDFESIVSDMENVCYNKYFYNFLYVDGDYFGAFPGLTGAGRFALFGADNNYICYADYEKTFNAYLAARQARFEWGESPMLAN